MASTQEDAGKAHLKRRIAIRSIDKEFVAKHEAADPSLAIVATVVLVAQMGIAIFVAPVLPTWAFWTACATIGALLAHMTFLGMHEAVHDHFFPESLQWANWVAGFLVQMPLLIPVATKFKQFHLIHHARQATDFDPDEPSAFEERFFLSTPPGRIVWACTQFVWYLLRPLFMTNLKVRWEVTDTLCVATQIATLGGCALWMKEIYGPEAWLGAVGTAAGYLALSIVFAMGPSPFSAHFLIDHRPTSVGASPVERGTTPDSKEMTLPSTIPHVPTFNYYGFWNYFSYNVGYHTEHHDFPKASGFALPALHDRFAPIYNRQPCSTSWLRSHWDFITLPYTYKQLNRTDRDATGKAAGKEERALEFGAKEAMNEGQNDEVDPDAGTPAAPAAPAPAAAAEAPAPASGGKGGARRRRAE